MEATRRIPLKRDSTANDGQKEDRSRFSSNAFADHSLIRIMMMGVIMEEPRESLGPPKKVKTYFRNAIYALIVFGLRALVQTEDRRMGDEGTDVHSQGTFY